MIFDKLENVNQYKGLSANLDRALAVIEAEDFTSKDPGKYEVDGENVFYMVQDYETLPAEKGKLEAHLKYIDIQLVVRGMEIIGVENLNGQAIEHPYDKDEDYALYKKTGSMTELKISSGQFCILFPQDLHMPCIADSIPAEVKKVVFKVKL